MRALFRPATTLNGLRVAALDEDEATLAVAAGRALIRVRKIPRETITRLECVGDTGKGWGSHVQIALGLSHAGLEDSGTGPVPASTLRITSNVPRPASSSAVTETLAIAEFPGDGKDLDVSERSSRAIDNTKAEKIRSWESKALLQAPMGAYIPRATWDASLAARYRLVAGYCPTCKRGHHPRLDPCPICSGRTETRELVGPGNLYTHTIIAAGGGPTEFDPLQDTEGTYGVAIVDFGDALRVAGLLTETDLSTLAIGQRMEPVFRRIYAQEGSWRYGTKFRAVGSS